MMTATQYFWENAKLMATKPPSSYNSLIVEVPPKEKQPCVSDLRVRLLCFPAAYRSLQSIV